MSGTTRIALGAIGLVLVLIGVYNLTYDFAKLAFGLIMAVFGIFFLFMAFKMK